MKHSLSILCAALLAVVAFTSFTPKTAAQSSKQSSGAVVFGAQQRYENGYPIGYVVYVVSQGQHAPQVLPGADLATTLEALLSFGFEVQYLPGLQFMAIRK